MKVALNTIKPNKKKPSSYYTTNQIGLLTLPPHPSPPTFWQNLYLQLVLKIYLWDLLVFFRPPSTIYTTISFFIWRIKLVSSPSFSSPIWWKLYGIALTQTFCILWDFHSTVKCSKNKIWLDIFFFSFYFVREGWGTFLFTYNHFLLFLGLIIISLILTTHESMSNYNIKLYTVHLAMCKSHTNNF